MPPIEAYTVFFANNGGLQPTLDVNNWGNMRFGGSSAGTLENKLVKSGLRLSAFRPPDAPAGLAVQNSVYVVPPGPGPTHVPGLVPLASRLQLRVEFDLPNAEPANPEVKAEPWAVALRLKFASNPMERPERDVPDEPMMNVTCQFNNNTRSRNGVRLNDTDRAQDAPANQPTDLDSPLSYARYRPGCSGAWGPTRFVLQFAFSGIQSGPAPAGPHNAGDNLGYAVGCGFLDLLGVPKWTWPLHFTSQDKKDLRVFSSIKLSSGAQSWIGAMGISVATVEGAGKVSARLRRFSVYTWS